MNGLFRYMFLYFSGTYDVKYKAKRHEPQSWLSILTYRSNRLFLRQI